jgi:hypothetical protein
MSAPAHFSIRRRWLRRAIGLLLAASWVGALGAEPFLGADAFIEQHCAKCHNDVDLEAKLN